MAPGDRVRLVALDLNAIPLTEGFVDPAGPEMAEALQKLNARVPLGPTDMAKALKAATDSFAADSKNAKSVIYVGDGMSPANLLGTEEFETLTGSLVDNRISVSSYAVGPRLDRQLLGALAGQTGGVVMVADETPAEAVGSALATAARADVLWPTEVTWPDEMGEVFPKRTPPLRADRDSVVVGTYKGKATMDIEIKAEGAAGPTTLSYSVQPNGSDDVNSYLAQVVDRARVDGGMSLPLVDSASLAEMQREVNVAGTTLSQLARQALASDNLGNAEQLANAALQRDPNDPEDVLKGGDDHPADGLRYGVNHVYRPRRKAPEKPQAPNHGQNVLDLIASMANDRQGRYA